MYNNKNLSYIHVTIVLQCQVCGSKEMSETKDSAA